MPTTTTHPIFGLVTPNPSHQGCFLGRSLSSPVVTSMPLPRSAGWLSPAGSEWLPGFSGLTPINLSCNCLFHPDGETTPWNHGQKHVLSCQLTQKISISDFLSCFHYSLSLDADLHCCLAFQCWKRCLWALLNAHSRGAVSCFTSSM